MSRNDDGFNLDDMMEIFGENVEAPASAKASAGRPASGATAVASGPAPKTTVDSLSDEEMAVLAAYERNKKEQKAKEEEARRKKEEDARKILDQYEKELAAAREREAKLRKELEEKQRREIEELKKKEEFKVDESKLAEEEAKIIEEFEKQARAQKEKDEADKRAKEEKAQAELKALADKQRAEEEARRAEEEKKDAEIKAKAADAMGDKKEGRLMELLAKAKAELDNAPPSLAPPPPAGGAAAPAAPAGQSSRAKELLIDIEQKECDAFLLMLDETRKSMFTYLAPLIGIKASTNMLNKTVEKARAKAPVILKDANWRMDGSLREDGSIDNERILANVQKVGVGTRVDDFLAGLHALVSLRFGAVDQGLGANTASGMRHKVADARAVFEGKGIQKPWIDLFYSNVIGI